MKEKQLTQFVSEFLEKAPPIRYFLLVPQLGVSGLNADMASLGICSVLFSNSNLWDTSLKNEFWTRPNHIFYKGKVG